MLGFLSYFLIVVGAFFMFISPKLPEITISIISFFIFALIGFNASSNVFEGRVEFYRYVLPISGISGSLAGILAIFFSHVLFIGTMIAISAICYIIYVMPMFKSYEFAGLIGLLPVGFVSGVICHFYKQQVLSVLTCAIGSLIIGYVIKVSEVVPNSCIGMICLFLFITSLIIQYLILSHPRNGKLIKPNDGTDNSVKPVTYKDLNQKDFYV